MGTRHLLRRLRAREAPDRGTLRLFAATLGQKLVVWPVCFALLPLALFWVERAAGGGAWQFASPAARAGGILLFLLASAANLASSYVMVTRGRGTPLPSACARRLVVTGPYRYLRNPMAVSALAQAAGAGVYLGSPLALLYVLGAALLWQCVARPWEEEDLERRFGESYRRYREAVRCWIPRLRPYVADEERMEASEPRAAGETSPTLRAAAVAYLLLEGLSALAWWGVLLAVPGSRPLFMAPGSPDAALLAFGAADLLLFAGGAFGSAWGIARSRRWAWPVLCVHSGAAVYGALYCVTLPFLSGGGGLAAAVLMAPCLAVLPFLVWALRPPGLSPPREGDPQQSRKHSSERHTWRGYPADGSPPGR
jgi:protein-S-isoprenylcysteine O-methyltransferase Ste14